MPEVQTVVGKDFLPMLAGGVAAPLLAGLVPGLGRFGALAPAAVGLGMALLGKGALKDAGQGALLVSAVGLMSGLFGGAARLESSQEAF